MAYVDAPVSGGSEGAQKATLTIFAGGEPDALERARPLLEKTLAVYRILTPPRPLAVAVSLVNLGLVLRVAGEYEESEKVMKEALEVFIRLLGERHPKGVFAMAGAV